MSELMEMIRETVSFIRQKTDILPETGIILGTGLGGLTSEIEIYTTIDYSDIPHFALSTVECHSGKLIFGQISGKNIVAMQGRFHYYEGYSMEQITFPIRVMKDLGIKNILVSNACGSMNPYFRRGSIMLIDDHINLLGDNPLIGPNDEELGPRFPDMSRPYSRKLIKLAEKVALKNKIKLHKGVYVAMSGPCLETRAEYRFLRAVGADVVGMSTVPEVIVARHCGLRVLGLSIITDECYPETLSKVDINEIISVAEKAEPKLTILLKEIVGQI